MRIFKTNTLFRHYIENNEKGKQTIKTKYILCEFYLAILIYTIEIGHFVRIKHLVHHIYDYIVDSLYLTLNILESPYFYVFNTLERL